jgi:hypothetical protein
MKDPRQFAICILQFAFCNCGSQGLQIAKQELQNANCDAFRGMSDRCFIRVSSVAKAD